MLFNRLVSLGLYSGVYFSLVGCSGSESLTTLAPQLSEDPGVYTNVLPFLDWIEANAF